MFRFSVSRRKNDGGDAEAICEAPQRTTMRFVAVKTKETQPAAVPLRTRDLLIRRGHLSEFGIIGA
jgi:transposase